MQYEISEHENDVEIHVRDSATTRIMHGAGARVGMQASTSGRTPAALEYSGTPSTTATTVRTGCSGLRSGRRRRSAPSGG